MKRRVDTLDEMALTLDRLVDNPAIAAELNDEAIDMIQAMLKLDASHQALEVALQNAQRLAEDLRTPNRSRELYRLQDSDAGIARTLYLLNDAGRVLRKRQARGKLELSQMEAYIRDLAWAHLMVNVTSNVAQGHKALNNGDALRAYAFYKKAQQAALQTSINDDRRHTLIKELSDILANRRKSLSPSLMPETEFNPTDNAQSIPSGMMG